jgi:RimJ/RimL family protein N-acetyltransferase
VKAALGEVRTAHLRGRPLADADLDGFLLLGRDERVMRTLGGVRTDDEMRAAHARNLSHWQCHGFGLWSFCDRAGDFVGRGGLRLFLVDGRAELELAYVLRAEHWGRGYATEIARASVEAGFAELRAESIVAFTLPGNTASRRVMEKAGFGYERDFDHAPWGMHVLYRIRRGG